MAWFRAGGGGIPSSLKGDMNDVFNKKFGTVLQDYPPEYWPGTVNLMGPLPEKTVSGSVVAFSDGADAVKLKSCAVTIAPTLDGVSSVGVVKTGKNFIDFVSNVNTGTSVGMTFSATADGGISYSGTATGTFGYITAEFDFAIKSGQTFTFSRNTAFNYIHRIRLVFSDDTTANVSIPANATSVTYTPEKDIKAVRLLLAGLTADTYYNDTVYIQTEYGTTATAYTPYVTPTTHTANLGRTIYGGEVDVVNGTGTDEWGRVVYTGEDSENWAVTQASGIYRFYIRNDNVKAPDSGRGVIYSSIGTYASTGYAVGTCYSSYSNSKVFIYYVPPQTVTTVEDFKTWLQTNNFDVVYEKATPEDFTFTPVPIISRLGDNTMWSDGDLSVTYRRDIDLALAQ